MEASARRRFQKIEATLALVARQQAAAEVRARKYDERLRQIDAQSRIRDRRIEAELKARDERFEKRIKTLTDTGTKLFLKSDERLAKADIRLAEITEKLDALILRCRWDYPSSKPAARLISNRRGYDLGDIQQFRWFVRHRRQCVPEHGLAEWARNTHRFGTCCRQFLRACDVDAFAFFLTQEHLPASGATAERAFPRDWGRSVAGRASRQATVRRGRAHCA
jgi:hypothetical protein